jgi:hypothetical protein
MKLVDGKCNLIQQNIKKKRQKKEVPEPSQKTSGYEM